MMEGRVPRSPEVIYHVLVDRYDTGDDSRQFKPNAPDYLGGNLKGVIRRLPHIRDVGADTLWLSPVNGPGYHGYHPRNFFSVNPRFGSVDDVITLIEKAKEKGIGVMMDFVPNHMSVNSDIFQEALDPQSDKRSWFYFKGNADWTGFLKYREIPKLNLEDEGARSYVTDAAKFWLEQGVRGYRIDHVVGPSDGFWRHFRNSVKADYPDALLIGEATASLDDFRYIETFCISNKEEYARLASQRDIAVDLMQHYAPPAPGVPGLLDGALDFAFMNAMQAYAEGRVTRSDLQRWLDWNDSQFDPSFLRPAAVSNHDRGRISQYTQDQRKLEEIAEIQFSRRQPAVIYYGDEVGMAQRERLNPAIPHHDLIAREPMVWDRNKQNRALLERYKKLAARKRKSYAEAAA